MGKRSSYVPGTFCWVDFSAHDMNAAKSWYAELFGWEVAESDTQGGPPYAMFLKDGQVVAGLGQMNDEMKSAGVPPIWNSYVSVEDVAATAQRVEQHGGKVMVPPMKVLDAGWLAFFTDPTGAMFAAWQPGQHHGAQVVNEHGALSWNELATPDVEAAKGFYGEVFGWGYEAQAMPEFEYTSCKVGENYNGGIMPMAGPQWEGVPPYWGVYFGVDDADAMADKVAKAGGKVVVPPTDIMPGRFAVVQDPQGGTFTIMKLNQPSP